jgi:hypothetical protein
MKVFSKCGDIAKVLAGCRWRVVSPLEFLQHALSELGHKRLLSVMTKTLFLRHTLGVFLPHSGFVQQAKQLTIPKRELW